MRKPDYQRDGITLYCGDSIEISRGIGVFDLLLTDPPYGIGADKKKAHSSIRDNPEWQVQEWDRVVSSDAMQQLISKATTQIIWGGNYYALPASPCWLIWEKPEAGTGFSMADAELAWTNLTGAVRVKRLPRICETRIHPTQKPVALLEWCLSFAKNAKSVFDPFMGSGSSVVACVNRGVECVAIEQDSVMFEKAVKRIETALNTDRDSLWTAKELAKETQTALFE